MVLAAYRETDSDSHRAPLAVNVSGFAVGGQGALQLDLGLVRSPHRRERAAV